MKGRGSWEVAVSGSLDMRREVGGGHHWEKEKRLSSLLLRDMIVLSRIERIVVSLMDGSFEREITN